MPAKVQFQSLDQQPVAPMTSHINHLEHAKFIQTTVIELLTLKGHIHAFMAMRMPSRHILWFYYLTKQAEFSLSLIWRSVSRIRCRQS